MLNLACIAGESPRGGTGVGTSTLLLSDVVSLDSCKSGEFLRDGNGVEGGGALSQTPVIVSK